MTTEPQRPSTHYTDAVRLLAAAESVGTDVDRAQLSALCAIASAVLASAPRRARRPRRDRDAGRHHGGSPLNRWITGQTDQDGAT